MPNVTENYGLKKPLPEEFYDVGVQNENMDIIDAELKKRATLDASGKVPEEQLPDTTFIPVTSEIPSNSDIWIDPDDVPVEESHLNDKNNPHGVTIAQIGALSAFVGYFEASTNAEIDLVLRDRMSEISNFERKHFVLAVTGVFATLFSDLWYTKIEKNMTTVYITASNSYNTVRRVYNVVSDTFGEWEWENPPMALEVEYRTTERHEGSPVFTKLVSFGALPNTSEKGMKLLAGGERIIDFRGYADGEWRIPLAAPYVSSILSIRGSGQIYLTTTTDLSGYTGYFVLKYTKYDL